MTAAAAVSRLSVREILHPRAVAVFGASEDRDKFGGRIVHFLIAHGFTGRIVPINPRRVLVFRASHVLKDSINVALGKAGTRHSGAA